MKHDTLKRTNIKSSNGGVHASCFMLRDQGFTLVELVVAIAVFATVVTLVSSIFVSSVGSQRKNINNQDVLDNGRYVLETMGRAIRQGIITQPPSDATQSTIQLNHPTKGVVVYQLDNGQVKETSGGNTTTLSSSNVTVQKLTFAVQGNSAPPSDTNQPRVTISISIKSTQSTSGTDSIINLQTTVTPRNLQAPTE